MARKMRMDNGKPEEIPEREKELMEMVEEGEIEIEEEFRDLSQEELDSLAEKYIEQRK